jgi:hypothetical protein
MVRSGAKRRVSNHAGQGAFTRHAHGPASFETHRFAMLLRRRVNGCDGGRRYFCNSERLVREISAFGHDTMKPETRSNRPNDQSVGSKKAGRARAQSIRGRMALQGLYLQPRRRQHFFKTLGVAKPALIWPPMLPGRRMEATASAFSQSGRPLPREQDRASLQDLAAPAVASRRGD